MDFESVFAPYHPPATSFADQLRFWARKFPNEMAYAFWNGEDAEPTRITFQELDRQARAVAAELAARKLIGQRALLLYPPGLDFVIALFGCFYSGVVAIPAYPPRRSRNMERIDAISDDAQAAVVLSNYDTAHRSSADHAPHLKRIPWIDTDRLAVDLGDHWNPPELSPDGLAILQYTSGSTGAPKGVMLTQKNLIHNCKLITYGFGPDRANGMGLSWLPTYHDMGLVGGVLEAMFVGRPSVLMSPLAFLQRPIRWLRGISRFRATISGGPNFAYALCNEKITPEECEGLDLRSWEVAFNGAEPVRAETLDAFTEKFAPYGFRREVHYPCYGMAETTLLVTGGTKSHPPVMQSFDASALDNHRVVPVADDHKSARRLVSSGRPMPGDDVVIVDPETCEPLTGTSVGEIWVSGPSVAQGYWNKPEETQQSFGARLAGRSGNYLRTGDLGFLHEGELFVTGRCKDLIIIRGRNLYPHDVELTIEKCHPSLRTGGGACFSIDIDGEERLVVVHELERQQVQSDGQAIIDTIRTAVLEEHEAPLHSVCLLRVGKLPKTSSGKVQRRTCREAYLKGELETLIQWTAESVEPEGRAAHATITLKSTAIGGPIAREIQDWLVTQVAARLRRSTDSIDVHAPFARFGLDSLALVEISGDLEKYLGQSVSPTVLYSFPTIADLADHLASPHAFSADESGTDAPLGEPIAVVGVACRFPGASDPDEFWRLLQEGRDAIGQIPSSRWNADDYYDPDQTAAGAIYTREGGFIDGVDQFDPQFFGIAPREAPSIDPQQRLLLETAWQAFENAGIAADRIAGDAVGVFVGISNCDYARLQAGSDLRKIDAYTGTGTAFSIAAGRLAYVLGVHGPCLAIDTACSSSLVAVHLAVQSLRKRECRAALAGGVNLMLDPSSTVALCRLQALAPDGRCKTFDSAADGYGRGEGCGMVLLKRLADAVEDGDSIWAVIRGTAVNHDGRSNGLTAPHGPSQEALLRSALADAHVKSEEVGYIEAHGTGTSLGDPIEVQALASVLGGREASNPFFVGSVKTNIGHLEAAAGIAGLIKTVLALRYAEIPPHLHFRNPNPYIPWDRIPIQIPVERTPWPQSERRRIAGVSSFGFSGTNAHVVLEESPQPPQSPAESTWPGQLVVLSAKDESALRELADRHADLLTSHPQQFAAICQTAALGRSHFSHRLAFFAENSEQASSKLRQIGRGERPATVVYGRVDQQRPPIIAGLFTGQGSQFVGMAYGLYQTHPKFREVLDRCDAILREYLPQPLLEVLFGAEGLAVPADQPSALLHQTLYTQPALFAVEYALYELWKSWGIEPDLALGHSIGEYVAACALGVFRLEDALRLVAARGRLMQELPASGAMVAVAADEKRVRALLHKSNGHIDIAAVNSPQQTVLSGPATSLEKAVASLEAAGLRTSRLRVSHAFHSSLMEPMLDEFERLCGEIPFQPPRRPIASNVHGRLVTDEIATPRYWREQIRGTVRFADGLAALDAGGADVYLEIGPKPILTPAGRQTLSDRGQLWLASLKPSRNDWSQMLECAAELYVRGAELNWEGFYHDQPRRKVVLPNYPFQRARYWIEGEIPPPPSAAAPDKTAASPVQDSIDDWLFEVRWQPRSRLDQYLPRRVPDYIPDTRTLSAAVQPEIERLTSQLRLPRYVELLSELDRLSAGYVQNALQKLGWQPQRGDTFTTIELAERLNITGRFRLLHHLLEMLADEGILVAESDHWSIAAVPAVPDLASRMEELLSRVPECVAELTLLASCAGNLAEVLRGEVDPLQLLFPQGSTDLVERLYRDSPFARSLNSLLEETLSRAIADLPADRTLKILEIGAGTGGTTSHLVSRLPADRTEYVFTDVSQVFTQEAAAKFRQYPFLRYSVLDLETDPGAQGYAPGQFDMVIASNVLHASRNLRESLAHVRYLLAPEGVVLLIEGTHPQRWLDLIFGLTDGWWRFSGDGVRDKHPLVSADTWRRLMAEQGFKDFAALPEANPAEGPPPPQAVLFARLDAASSPASSDAARGSDAVKPAQTSMAAGKWLVLADQRGVGADVAGTLTGLGHSCDVVTRDQSRRLAGLLENQSYEGIVHLWSLDAAPAEQLSVAKLDEAQGLAYESAVDVLQSLIRHPQSEGPRTWFATCGAQPVVARDPLPGLAQSPLWGLGRVVAEEQPNLWGGLIDLDPAAGTRDAARVLCDEILRKNEEDQLAYRVDQRYGARLVRRLRQGATHRPLRWRTDASYLITGGLGDVGLRVAEWMVDQGAHHLIVTGRTPLPPRTEWDDHIQRGTRQGLQVEGLKRLESRGAAIRVVAVDVTDEAAMREMLRKLVEDGWPPIRGVFHAAGQADAQPLSVIRRERRVEVMGPKMTGGWVLHHLLKHERLDFFVCCSSGAAILPSPLMGLYSAASSFPDALAHYRRAANLPALTVNWGFWEQTANLSPALREIGPGIIPVGMRPFTTEQGLAALRQLLEQEAVNTAVMPVDLDTWRRAHPGTSQSSLLANLRLTETLGGGSAAAEAGPGDAASPREAIVAAPPQARRQLAESYLRERISDVLRIPAEKLDANQSLNNLGIDSLMAVELRNHVQAKLGVTIPLAMLLQDPTIAQLAQVVLDQVGGGTGSETATEDAAPPPQDALPAGASSPPAAAVETTLDQLQELSDEEVDAMLRRMLNEEQPQA